MILERYETREISITRDGEEKDTLARFTFNNLVEVEVRKQIYETAEEIVFFPSFVSFRAGSNNKYINMRFLCLFHPFPPYFYPFPIRSNSHGKRNDQRKENSSRLSFPFFAFPLCLIPRFYYTRGFVSYIHSSLLDWSRCIEERKREREESEFSRFRVHNS